jgi:hypothetical protein
MERALAITQLILYNIGIFQVVPFGKIKNVKIILALVNCKSVNDLDKISGELYPLNFANCF